MSFLRAKNNHTVNVPLPVAKSELMIYLISLDLEARQNGTSPLMDRLLRLIARNNRGFLPCKVYYDTDTDSQGSRMIMAANIARESGSIPAPLPPGELRSYPFRHLDTPLDHMENFTVFRDMENGETAIVIVTTADNLQIVLGRDTMIDPSCVYPIKATVTGSSDSALMTMTLQSILV